MDGGKAKDDTMKISSGERQSVLQRFAEACETDERVVAAFLGGSFAAGTADEHSDLDLYLIATDEAYDDFFAQRQAFMRRLGQPVFLEDFNDFGFDMVWFTFADGVEGELALARESRFDHIHGGPYKVLVDKKGLLDGKTFPLYKLTEEQQRRTLHQLIYWFWDNLSHFITAMHRTQLWTAYGSLDEMQMKCLKLVRLARDFTSEHTAYSNVERIVPEQELLPLKTTCSPLEAEAMLQAACTLVQAYREIAPPLATKHGLTYPVDYDKVISNRLKKLRDAAPKA
jgi:predicted nucleotidyltransferase